MNEDIVNKLQKIVDDTVESKIIDRVEKALQKMDHDHAEKLSKVVDAIHSHYKSKIRIIDGNSKALKYDHHGSEPSSEFVITTTEFDVADS